MKTWSMMSKEIETLKEDGRQYRQQNAPRDWWQELALELARKPETLDKILSLTGNPQMLQLFQQMKK